MKIKTLRNFGAMLLLLGNIGIISGAPIDVNQAKDIAVRFRNSGALKLKKNIQTTANELSLSYTAKSDVGDCFYIFNAGNDGGYTIVAADDCIADVLGYSESGSFDPNNIPENMKWWLSEYEKEIEYILSNPDKIKTSKEKMPEMATIAPKTTTKWNQSAPYNNLCPLTNGQRCVTGCVATAMAQVMKFHNWPVNPTGSANGVTFSGTTLEWSNMIDDYTGTYTSLQATAVATLMRQCGASVAMQYSPSSSGAYSNDVGPAWYTYFGYDKGIRYHLRDYYTLDKWIMMVYNEIVNNGPVYYSGRSSSGGHAFVADGYSGNGYFHFNWGWGGYQDGYFRLFALNPSSGGIGSYEGGYNSSQSIYTDLKKAQSTPGELQSLLIANDGYIYSNGIISIENGGLFYNPLGCTQNLYIGVKLKNVNSNDSVVFGTFSTDLDKNYGYRSLSEIQIPNSVPDGTYKMTIVYRGREVGKEIWNDVMIPNGYRNYMLVTKSGSSVKVTNPEVETNYKLIVNSLESSAGDFYFGTDNFFTFTVSNVGSTDYQDNIVMGIYKTLDAEKPARKFNLPIYSPAGISVSSSVVQYIPVQPGEYYVKFTDVDGNVLNDPFTVTFKDYESPMSNSTKVFVSSVTPNNYTIGGGNAILQFSLNNTSASPITAVIGFKLFSIDGKEIKGWQTSSLSIAAGETKYKYSIGLDAANLKPGYYFWRITNNNTNEILSEDIFFKANGAVQEVNGVAYLPFTETTAKVTQSQTSEYSGSIVIPSNAGNYTIDAIESDVFTFASNLSEVTIPSTINSLGNGLFYQASSLKKLYIESASVPSVTSFTFGPSLIDNIELNVADGLANLYKQTDIWSSFSFPAWDITLDNIKVTGLAINPSTGNVYSPYYVSPQEELTISYPAIEGDEITYEYSIGNGSTVTKKAENGKIVLPALGKESGKLKIYYTKQTGVESLINDAVKVTVVTMDGLVVLKNADATELKKLPKGIYIVNGKKMMVK